MLRIWRKLTIEIALTYREDDNGNSMPASRRVKKRGRVSATSRMLAEREAHIEAEEETTGQTSTWSRVYELMRCDVRSCPLRSDWCWEDPKDKKHYKLRTPHLERLIDYVDEGGILDGHDDVHSLVNTLRCSCKQIFFTSTLTVTVCKMTPRPPALIF